MLDSSIPTKTTKSVSNTTFQLVLDELSDRNQSYHLAPLETKLST